MKTKVAILGSTGSIGVNTLDIVSRMPERFKIVALAAGSNVDRLAAQTKVFRPNVVSISTEDGAKRMARSLPRATKVLFGEGALEEIVSRKDVDIVVFAVSGTACVRPLVKAIQCKKRIALANKESIVSAGPAIMKLANECGVKIIPIDSEHSAIFQCLAGQMPKNLKRIILTASGGPFFNLSKDDLKKVTWQQALKHPRWKMGRKITIDSASMMNKGLEVIEAKWLFNVDIARIDVLIHPQSVVHSLIELLDGSVLAQLGIADMRIPIAYALDYPNRLTNDLPGLNLAKASPLEFHQPDMKKFPCLGLAYEAGRLGGTTPVALNAANEVAVAAFLENKICFNDLSKVIEKVLNKHQTLNNPSLEDILDVDNEARMQAQSVIKKLKKG